MSGGDMRAPITTHAALLLALRQGAGYGLELIRRVESMSAGRVHLAEARVYTALGGLKRQGLVAISRVAPGGRRGARSRTYYELTLRGVEASTIERATLRALATPPPNLPSAREVRLMAQRIVQAGKISEFARDLRAAMPSRS
jgi:DNA-binding PadR family transcriptional regulator